MVSSLRTLAVVTLTACGGLGTALANDDTALPISAFADQSIANWKQHSFGNGTDYQLVELDDRWALQAHSQGAASAFYRSVEIDLEKTPILSWSWRVEQPLVDLDEMQKSGDDYAARVYVVHKNGFFDKGVAVNYVWSGSHETGSRSYMLALQDAATPLAEWQTQRRDVRKDFQELLGMDVRTVQVVVLMTDTDNSGQSARAHYGDLVFSRE